MPKQHHWHEACSETRFYAFCMEVLKSSCNDSINMKQQLKLLDVQFAVYIALICFNPRLKHTSTLTGSPKTAGPQKLKGTATPKPPNHKLPAFCRALQNSRSRARWKPCLSSAEPLDTPQQSLYPRRHGALWNGVLCNWSYGPRRFCRNPLTPFLTRRPPPCEGRKVFIWCSPDFKPASTLPT